MFKLENYSLKQRMQMVALIGVVCLFILTGLYWILNKMGVSHAQQDLIGLIFAIVVGAALYGLATMIGNFGGKRANVLVDGIQDIK